MINKAFIPNLFLMITIFLPKNVNTLNSVRLRVRKYYSSQPYSLSRKMNFLVDFDANLLHEHLSSSTSTLLQDAESLGIKIFVVPGTNLLDSRDGMELKSNLSQSKIITTCGVHPYNAESVPFNESSKETLVQLIQDSRCSAVGECGLDYSSGFPDRSFQLDWFRFQVQTALQLDKPLYFHVRGAEADFLSVLQSMGFSAACDVPSVPCAVHCFTGGLEELQRYIDMGFYVGLTGFIFSLSDEDLRARLQSIGLGRLLIETDAPYMGFSGCRATAAKKKGQKYPNVPAALVLVRDRIAAVSGWDADLVARATSDNAMAMLRLPQIPSDT